jgi:chorismate lyase
MVVKPSPALSSWLLDSGSFIERLQQQGLRPKIKIIGQYWQYPRADEREALTMKLRQYAFVREVLIQQDHVNLMFARAVIPHECLIGSRRQLLHLGEKSLGSFLFNYKGVERSPFKLTCTFMQPYSLEKVWGRCSLFNLKQKHLLLNEFFLPGIYPFL